MKRILVAHAIALLAFCGLAGDAGACRFWGLVGSGYPDDLIADHLRDGTVQNLQRLGGMNTDGWGLGYFLPPTIDLQLTMPIIRRGGPRANHPDAPEYGLSVDEIARIRPRAAIGHVRAGTSGHFGVPNPHPFFHEGILFAHNGSIPEPLLLDLLLSDDPEYLDHHPPDWVGGNIDSELYFLYLLKHAHAHRSLSRTESIRGAVQEVSRIAPGCRLNFVMTAGDTLYVLRYAPFDSGDAVQYAPATATGSSTWWAVASQPLGSSARDWRPIPARTLAVFVPGRPPIFRAIDPEGTDPVSRSRLLVGRPQPNPGRSSIEIPVVGPPDGGRASMEIWDVSGRLVRRVENIDLAAGPGRLVWDGRDMAGHPASSGAYYCRITSGSEVHGQTVNLIR